MMTDGAFRKVTLTREWMGHPPGTELTLTRATADRLTAQGTVKDVPDTVKDKMVRAARKTKAVRRRRV